MLLEADEFPPTGSCRMSSQTRRFSNPNVPSPDRRVRRRRLFERLESRQMLAAEILFADSFEQGEWNGNWAEDSQNDWFRSSQRSSDGSFAAEVDGRATNATLSMATPIDLSGYDSATMTFDWYIESGFDGGEYVSMDVSSNGGETWQTDVRRLSGNVDAENTWHGESVDLMPYASSNLMVRFRSLVSRSSEDANVDNVKIEGTLANSQPIGLVSHWTAENTSLDAEGRNDGTLVNGAGFTNGQIGQAFMFDGVNDGVVVEDSSSLRLTKSMTIEGWVRVDSFPSSGHGLVLFRGDDRGGLDPYQITTTPQGEIHFSVTGSNDSATLVAEMPLGRFVHVAGTLDDATGEMSLYLDGVRMDHRITTARPFGLLDPGSNPGIGIGNHGGFPTTPHNFPFHGAIDELKVYDVSLSSAEVLDNFYASKGDPEISIADATVVEGDFGFTFTDAFVGAGDGGLSSPRGITFGPDGNLYVANTDADNVLRYDAATGAFVDVFVPSGSGGLDFPRDIEFHDGDLFVASDLTHSVLRFNGSTGAFVSEFIASGSGGLERPRGLLFGANNDLYVASAGEDDAILRYDATTGAFIDEFVPSGDRGLNNPTRLAIGPNGNIYVSSTNSSSNSILRYAPNGNFIDTFVGPGVGGIDGPTDIVFDDALMYVGSARGDSILAYDQTTGDFVGPIVAFGSGGLNNPNSMLIDNAGRLYVTSSKTNEVLRYADSYASISTVHLSWPSSEVVTVNFSTSDGTADAGTDYESTTGTVTFAPGDTSQNVLVPILKEAIAEPDETFDVTLSGAVNASIVDPTGTVTIVERRLSIDDVAVIEGDSTPHYRGASGTGSPGGHFNPLTFGPDGNIYTAVGTGMGYNTIQRFDGTTGAFIDTFMDNSDPDHKINGVRDIVFHPTNGTVYVASSYTDEVLRYDAITGDFVDVFVSAGSGGIDHPDGMQFGPDSNDDGKPELYVTGWLSHNVVRYDGATGTPLGTYVDSGSGGLSAPFSLAFHDGELFVTSAGTNQILKYDADDGSYLGITASSGLDYPRGLTFGPDDLLYVTSGNNDRILRFTAQGQYIDDFVPSGTAGMDNPRTPRFGPDGDLYVTATGNNEIMRFGDSNDAVFTVSLSAASNEPFVVDYTTMPTGGSPASEGVDYQDTTGQVVFSPGQTERIIVVPIIDDFDPEPDETFEVLLSLSPSVQDILIFDGTGVGTIVDDGDTGPPNAPPVADDDLFSVSEDVALNVAALGVLDGDTDIENDPLTAVLVTQATNGIVVLHPDGSFIYTPVDNFHGSDGFTYVANDGMSDSDVATVMLTVTPVNDAPVAEAFAISTNENTSKSFAISASDVDGDTLAYTVLNGPANGTLSGTAPDLTYTPNVGYSGDDSFTFKANDGELDSNVATVSITVSAVAGTKFYVVDDSVDDTFEYQADGALVTNYDLGAGNNSPRGAAATAAGDTLWVIDNDDHVYVHDTDGTLLRSWKATGLSRPEGIATDGTDIWIVDRGNDRVHYFAGGATRTGDTGATSNFALVAGNPRGITTDGIHLWVVDTGTDDVYKYTTSGTYLGSWAMDSRNTAPRGITIDPSNVGDIWVVDSGDDDIYQYSGAATRLSGSQSADEVFNLASGNANPQGIADPPAPAEWAAATTRSRVVGLSPRVDKPSSVDEGLQRSSTITVRPLFVQKITAGRMVADSSSDAATLKWTPASSSSESDSESRQRIDEFFAHDADDLLIEGVLDDLSVRT